MIPSFAVTETVPQPFAYLRRHTPIAEISGAMTEAFAALDKAFRTAHAVPAGPPLAHYVAYDQEDTSFELGFPIIADDAEALKVAGLEIGETYGGPVMRGLHRGAYDTVTATYEAMMTDMAARGLVAAEDMWECYLSPPGTTAERIETEVIWGVAPHP